MSLAAVFSRESKLRFIQRIRRSRLAGINMNHPISDLRDAQEQLNQDEQALQAERINIWRTNMQEDSRYAATGKRGGISHGCGHALYDAGEGNNSQCVARYKETVDMVSTF